VPVCVRLADGRTSCELLDAPRGTLAAQGGCSDWEFGNAGGRGYYRVEYSSPALKALAGHVAALTPGERIALLSHQWALVRAGRDVGTFLDLASGLGAEREAASMQTLTNTLRTIGEEGTTTETLPAYRQWVSRLLTPSMRNVGWEAAANETDNTRALRATLVSALGETARDPGVLAEARTRVEQVLGGSATIEPTLLDAIVPIAAINGDAALYDKYLKRARETTAPEEHYRWLYALGGFTEPALVRRTMDLILSPEVRNQDAKVFLAVMLVNQDSHALAWSLLKGRWDEVQKKTGEFVGNTVFVGALASFCSADIATDMRAFFAAHHVPDAERTLQQSLERINGCVELHDAQARKLAEWLASFCG